MTKLQQGIVVLLALIVLGMAIISYTNTSEPTKSQNTNQSQKLF